MCIQDFGPTEVFTEGRALPKSGLAKHSITSAPMFLACLDNLALFVAALGKHWGAFVKSSIEIGKPIFIEAFRPGNVCCRGTITGEPCRRDPVTLKLGDMHLDHT